ncbi:MAG: DUF3098 domain-containing protein [Bacteroidota bacterium]
MEEKSKFAFDKMNYILMIAGVVVLLLGFYVMSIDTEEYGFGFYGITLGPIIVMLGFIIEFFAIMYKSKKAE